MRICYLANAKSIHTQRWVNYFVGKGHEVHLISPRPGEGYAQGVQLHQLTVPLPQKVWVALRSINVIVRIIKVKRLINKIKPDILDAHYITAYGYLAIISGFHPIVLTPWGSDILIFPKRSRFHKYLTRYALNKAELVICDSETVKKELLKLGTDSDKIRIIFNGVDTQKFSPQRGKEFKNRLGVQGVPTIICTRNLKPIYNVEMLIKAIPLVLGQVPEARFVLAGDGEQRGYLESLASSFGVLENVRFIGWVPHNELPGYLASSDVYVSTSLSDTIQVSLQEAMACELAPVVTDLPSLRESVTDGENGFLVPVNDIQALADRIVYLLKNEEVRKRFGRLGRKIIQERAEYETEMNKMEKIYQKLVRK